MDFAFDFDRCRQFVENGNFYSTAGKVTQVIGLTIMVQGIKGFVGEVCRILLDGKGSAVMAEVVGFRDRQVLLMPLGDLKGVGSGCKVIPTGKALTIQAGEDLLGKVLNGLGEPMEEEERGIALSRESCPVDRTPPNPLKRNRITNIMPTGIRAIDGLLTCGEGQRIGIFSGSGVGKSTLLGMISRYCKADVNVIALIGERGREVRDFIEKDLGEDGLKKSVVVCVTSDQPALVRIKGAYVATTIAEYFRDRGKKVMLMMDSVTRFAMAKREVGLAIGEPPATKGYTPSVFAELPRLLERSGTSERGAITAFYTVLVDGDDMNEPISDAVRGILDGHIVLSRKLAGQNHFPAIDVQQSISRLAREITSANQDQMAGEIRNSLAVYEKSEDLINIGAYAKGSNPQIDRAIALNGPINDFLTQDVTERVEYNDTLQRMQEILKKGPGEGK